MYGMIGGLSVLAYIKYKDGSMDRMMKNMKPMMECALHELKKQSRKITSKRSYFLIYKSCYVDLYLYISSVRIEIVVIILNIIFKLINVDEISESKLNQ